MYIYIYIYTYISLQILDSSYQTVKYITCSAIFGPRLNSTTHTLVRTMLELELANGNGINNTSWLEQSLRWRLVDRQATAQQTVWRILPVRVLPWQHYKHVARWRLKPASNFSPTKATWSKHLSKFLLIRVFGNFVNCWRNHPNFGSCQFPALQPSQVLIFTFLGSAIPLLMCWQPLAQSTPTFRFPDVFCVSLDGSAIPFSFERGTPPGPHFYSVLWRFFDKLRLFLLIVFVLGFFYVVYIFLFLLPIVYVIWFWKVHIE